MARAVPVETEPNGAEPPPPDDPRWDLVQRVAASAAFQKSKRLQQFLLFVCERALRAPDGMVREQEIGTEVFGRPADFDTSQDTLVRVHASQLRKRLQQYFAAEGADELLIIEIPKGTYRPVFRERGPAPDAAEDGVRPRLGTWWLAILAAALGLLVSTVWLSVENRDLRRRLEAGLEPRPAVDAMWRQFFANGRHTYVILADSNLTMFQDLIGRQLNPTEYQRQQFRQIAERRADKVTADFAVRLMNRSFTSMADARLAHRVGLLNAAQGIPTAVLVARDAGPHHLKSHNAVLSGSRRGNPWLELFEERLNFRTHFDETTRTALFENRTPRAGEPPRYVAQWDRSGFCRVAFLPNLDSTGNVLILSGTEMASSEAGAEFITGERWVRRLRDMLGAAGGQPLPYFEVLLHTQLVMGAAPTFELIAHRVVGPAR